ncbi:MAG: LacI family DNA-binding transcriptional regulator [Spirochaetales bacterium]|jgi:LacI family transcriptional regulator
MSRSVITMRDVALALGVSTATVSRVLNDDPRVKERTRLEVRTAVDKLGYRPNQVARSLKTRATRTVGVIAPGLASLFFMQLSESMENELAAHGYSLIVCSSRESVENEKKRMQLLAAQLVDAIVMIPSSNKGDHLYLSKGKDIPLVFIDRVASGVLADAVVSDNENGAKEATRALIADGYRRIGFIGGDLEVSTARERYDGYIQAMKEAGLEPEPDFMRFGSLHVESGYRQMAEMLARPDAPEAYFIVNADTHIGATNYLMTEGKAFRDKIVFASFDEMEYSPLLLFCRYSVQQQVEEMGKTAARILLERIHGKGGEERRTIRLSTKLIRHSMERSL